MLKFILIRHAESAGTTTGRGDFDRTLTASGKSAAIALGKLLSDQVITPVDIYCSSAKRTMETSEILAGHIGGTIHSDIRFYNGGLHDYLGALQSIGPRRQLILVGHNPVVTELHYYLTGTWSVFRPGTCAVLTPDDAKSMDSIPLHPESLHPQSLIHPG